MKLSEFSPLTSSTKHIIHARSDVFVLDKPALSTGKRSVPEEKNVQATQVFGNDFQRVGKKKGVSFFPHTGVQTDGLLCLRRRVIVQWDDRVGGNPGQTPPKLPS